MMSVSFYFFHNYSKYTKKGKAFKELVYMYYQTVPISIHQIVEKQNRKKIMIYLSY